jgi:hypothetical protein
MLFPPQVPRLHSLPKNIQMFLVRHSPLPLLRQMHDLSRPSARFQRALVSFTALL